jgi:hypothetical protein
MTHYTAIYFFDILYVCVYSTIYLSTTNSSLFATVTSCADVDFLITTDKCKQTACPFSYSYVLPFGYSSVSPVSFDPQPVMCFVWTCRNGQTNKGGWNKLDGLRDSAKTGTRTECVDIRCPGGVARARTDVTLYAVDRSCLNYCSRYNTISMEVGNVSDKQTDSEGGKQRSIMVEIVAKSGDGRREKAVTHLTPPFLSEVVETSQTGGTDTQTLSTDDSSRRWRPSAAGKSHAVLACV